MLKVVADRKRSAAVKGNTMTWSLQLLCVWVLIMRRPYTSYAALSILLLRRSSCNPTVTAP